MEDNADLAMAQARTLGMLMLELSEALVSRGALTSDDVTGALLRAEWCAEIVDKDDGNITHPHVGLARLTTEEWSKRLGIAPSLYALRKLHTEWLASGRNGPAPLSPEQVIEWSRDDDESSE